MRNNTANFAPCAPIAAKFDHGIVYPRNTDDFIRDCLACDACFKLGPERIANLPAGQVIINEEPVIPTSLNGRTLANPVKFTWADPQNRVERCPDVKKLHGHVAKIGGFANASMNANGDIPCNGNSLQDFVIQFDAPVDLLLTSASMSGPGIEHFVVGTPVDEFYPGVASSLPRQNNLPTGTIWSNANNLSPSLFVYRNVTQVSFQVKSQAGLTCGVNIRLLRWYEHLDRIVCPVRQDVGPACPGGTVRTENAIACQHMPAPSFLPTYTAAPPLSNVNGWEYSTDFGGTWNPAPPGNVIPNAGLAAGQLRYRRAYNVPTGYGGFIRFFAGLAKSINANFGSFWLDGVQIAANTEAFNNIRFFSNHQPLTVGPHVIEWRAGATAPSLNAIAPELGTDYLGVTDTLERNINVKRCFDGANNLLSETYANDDGTPVVRIPGDVITPGACNLMN